MRPLATVLAIPCVIMALACCGASLAQNSNSGGHNSTDQAGKDPTTANADNGNGAVEISSKAGATMPDSIKLTDEERQTIRQVLAQKKTDEMFNEPATKKLKDFAPAIGEKVPPALHLQHMPTELARKVPAVGNYGYMKVKDQVLIINPMSKTIVDMFPQRAG